MPIFTQILSDTFQRANEAPLDPVHWHSVFGAPPSNDEPQIENNLCTTTVVAQADGAVTNINDSLPPAQYAEFQMQQETINGACWLYLRAGQNIYPVYAMVIFGEFNVSPPNP